METLTTLNVYKSLKTEWGMEGYLLNVRYFKGAQCKFRARTATLGINADQERWGARDGACDLCDFGKEDIFHIFFSCSAYADLRQSLFSEIEQHLSSPSKFLGTFYSVFFTF